MTTVKLIVMAIHNLLRWAILLLAVYALYKTINGWTKKQAWSPTAQKALTYFSISLDVQLLTGFLLYFVFSDLTKAAFSNFADAMGNQLLRFFTVEHSILMFLAVVGAHLASAAGKKDITDDKKFRRATVLLILTLLAILAGIPWNRPLLPVF